MKEHLKGKKKNRTRNSKGRFEPKKGRNDKRDRERSKMKITQIYFNNKLSERKQGASLRLLEWMIVCY